MANEEAVAVQNVHSQIVKSLNSGLDITNVFISGKAHDRLETLFDSSKLYALELDKHVVTKQYRMKYFFYAKNIKNKLEAMIADSDVVIVDGITMASFLSPLIRRYKKKCLVIVHGSFDRVSKSVRYALPRLDLIDIKFCGVSEHVSSSLVRDLMIDKSKVTSVLNGVDVFGLRSKQLDGIQARRALDLPDKQFVVGVSARLEGQKNISRLIGAFAFYKSQGGKGILAIIGDGSYRNDLYEQVLSLDLKDDVRFLGYVSEAYKYYKAMNVFSLLSDVEGMPISVLEAISTPLPVILSDIGPHKELKSLLGDKYCRIVSSDEEFNEALSDLYQEATCVPAYGDKEIGVERMRCEYKELILDFLASPSKIY